jgi:hypothetical protein
MMPDWSIRSQRRGGGDVALDKTDLNTALRTAEEASVKYIEEYKRSQ